MASTDFEPNGEAQAPPSIDWQAELARHGRWLRTVVAARIGEPDGVAEGTRTHQERKKRYGVSFVRLRYIVVDKVVPTSRSGPAPRGRRTPGAIGRRADHGNDGDD